MRLPGSMPDDRLSHLALQGSFAFLEGQFPDDCCARPDLAALFADFLGYTPTTFQLSDSLRKMIFKAFVANLKTNPVKHVIFTVMIDFSSTDDLAFLSDIASIFSDAGESVYFIELVADIAKRRERNRHPERLAAKPSKRDLAFSMQDLEDSVVKYQLESQAHQLAEYFPDVQTLKINNTELSPEMIVKQLLQVFPRLKC